MRALRLRFDFGLLVVSLVATLAAWPLITRSSLPTGADADLHIYRTQQIIEAWKRGVPYLRWAPDFAFGFGYPVFNYYAPLSHYLSAVYGYWCCDATRAPVAGVKFTLVACTYLGVIGMYRLGRDLWGASGSIISSTAFSLAPYVVYIDPLARGAAPETLAVALAPWTLWAFWRLHRHPTRRGVALAALVLATLLLAHNLLSFVFVGMLLAWLAWEVVGEWMTSRNKPPFDLSSARSEPNEARRSETERWSEALTRRVVAVGAALMVGAGLAAFMWLPAMVERHAVQFERAFVDVSRPATILQWVNFTELLGFNHTEDVADPRVAGWRFRLGVAQWVLGGAGLLALVVESKQRRTRLFFGLVTLSLTFLVTPASAWLWKNSLLTYLQLPWRLLGPAAVALAVLAGGSVAWIKLRGLNELAFSSMVVAVCLVGVWPLLNPLPWSDYGPVNDQRLFIFERNGNIGTTAQNEFLPADVKTMPAPRESLLQSYADGVVDKVNHQSLPEGTQVSVLEHGPKQDRFHVTTPTDFDLQIFTFDFPGWTAYLDGVQTAVWPSEPEGFITFKVPAGSHEVLVKLEDTFPRQLGWLISGLAGITAIGLISGVRLWPTFSIHRAESWPHLASTIEPLAWRYALILSVLLLGGILTRFLADRSSPWQREPITYEAPPAQHPHLTRLDHNLALLAYDLPQTSAHPGDQVPLTLYWKATGRVAGDWSVFVHVIGPDGQLWGQSDKARPVADWPTDRWPTNRYFQDDHLIALRPDAPPGTYTLRVGLWESYSGVRLKVLDANLTPAEDAVTLITDFRIHP